MAMVSTAALCAGADGGRNPVTQAQVAAALSNAGTPVTPGQVTLMADVVATTNRPSLQVDSVQARGDRQVRVRMSCATAQECLPFIVEVNVPWGSAPHAFTSARAPRNRETAPIVVRSGSAATLLIDQGRIHIRLQVVCMESGAMGQTIRVQDRISKRIYLAQIADETRLRGGL